MSSVTWSRVGYQGEPGAYSEEAALAALHRQIGGVTRVSLTGGDAEMINQLSNGLRRRGINVGDGAEIEIRFTGSVESHGFGKKSRSATATVRPPAGWSRISSPGRTCCQSGTIRSAL